MYNLDEYEFTKTVSDSGLTCYSSPMTCRDFTEMFPNIKHLGLVGNIDFREESEVMTLVIAVGEDGVEYLDGHLGDPEDLDMDDDQGSVDDDLIDMDDDDDMMPIDFEDEVDEWLSDNDSDDTDSAILEPGEYPWLQTQPANEGVWMSVRMDDTVDATTYVSTGGRVIELGTNNKSTVEQFMDSDEAEAWLWMKMDNSWLSTALSMPLTLD